MSWDVELYVPLTSLVLTRGDGRVENHGLGRVVLCEWNYTSNTSPMIYRTLPVVRPGWDPETGEHWYEILDGSTGADGAEYLDRIVNCLMEAPEMFRGMNPPNGWGDYDSLLAVLAEMRDAGREQPTATWAAGA